MQNIKKIYLFLISYGLIIISGSFGSFIYNLNTCSNDCGWIGFLEIKIAILFGLPPLIFGLFLYFLYFIKNRISNRDTKNINLERNKVTDLIPIIAIGFLILICIVYPELLFYLYNPIDDFFDNFYYYLYDYIVVPLGL